MMDDYFQDLSILDVDNLNTSLDGSSLNEVSNPSFTITNNFDSTYKKPSDNKFLNAKHIRDNGNKASNLSLFTKDRKQYYLELMKPACSNLDISYLEILADPAPKGDEEIRAIVEARAQKILESVKRELLNKSFSCPNLQKLNNNITEEDSCGMISPSFNFQNTNNEQFNHKPFDINNSNSFLFSTVPKETSMNRFTSGSVEVLNNPNFNESFTLKTKPYEEYMNTHCNNSFQHSLQKSYSFNCLPSKNDSIMDIEPKLEDSVPSEDEVDEMGLPVKRFIYTHTPLKKNDDISDVVAKYKKLRASIGEPNIDGEEPEVIVNAVKEPPMLQGIKDTQLKKTQSTISKGPLKALVPLQNMTKQMGVKIMSPFKKKKEKKLDFTIKNNQHKGDASSSILNDNLEDINPVAASTPSSDRGSRRDSMCNNSTFVRSLSEGRITPVKKTNGPILNVSYTKSDQSCSSKMNSTITLKQPISKQIKQPFKPAISSLAQPKMKYSIGKRPSTAPSNNTNSLASIKAPLTTNQRSVKQSIMNQSTVPKVNLPRASLAKTSVNNMRPSLKSNLNTVSKFRRANSTFDKENKIK